MDFYRNTFVEINTLNIKENIKKTIKKMNEKNEEAYEYYFGVVKADSYSHQGIQSIKAIIEAGANYLATATLDEALEIRKEIDEIPILCLGYIPYQYLNVCEENNITVTITSIEYYKEIENLKNIKNKIKCHIKLNTGMNRLGISNKQDMDYIVNNINNAKFELEGIFTHIYEASNEQKYLTQIEKFQILTQDVNMDEIKIKHIAASDSMVKYKKLKSINGCRMGINMYGLLDDEFREELKSTFSLKSEVIQIHELKKGEIIGYEADYKVEEEIERIAIIPIGYADGIIRKNTGRYVYINNAKYKIVGNICMDMLFVKVDDNVKLHDSVEVIKDKNHIIEIAEHLDTITYEVMCSIGKRVPRIYI